MGCEFAGLGQNINIKPFLVDIPILYHLETPERFYSVLGGKKWEHSPQMG